MEGKNNLDKLFKDRLSEDNPAFKEEYWKGFESLLNTAVPATTPEAASTFSKMLNVISGVKVLLITVASVASLSVAAYFYLHSINHHNTTIPKEITSSIPQNELKTTENTKSQSSDNNTAGNKTGSQMDETMAKPGIAEHSHGKDDLPKESNISSTRTSSKNNAKATATSVNSHDPKTKLTSGKNPSNAPLAANHARTKKAANLNPSKKESRKDAGSSAPSGNTSTEEVRTVPGGASFKTLVKEDVTEPRVALELPVTVKTNIASITIPSEPQKTDSTAITAISAEVAKVDSQEVSGSPNPFAPPMTAVEKDNPFHMFLAPGVSTYKTMGNDIGFTSQNKFAFQFGAGASYDFNPSLSLFFEVNYLRTTGHKLYSSSSSISYLFYPWTTVNYLQNREYSQFQIPVILQYHYNKHSLGVGPTFSILYKVSGEMITQDSTIYSSHFVSTKADNYTSGFNKFIPGLAAEYSFNFYKQHAIIFRYSHYFKSLTDPSLLNVVGNKNPDYFSIMLRVRIF